jgi:hypothetical protein
MAAKYEQENWAYKYTDYVFGPPTIARTTMKYIRRMIRNQCIYIYWYDKTEYHFKCEHGGDPQLGEIERCNKHLDFELE